MAHLSKTVANHRYSDINPATCGYERCAPSHFYGPAVRSEYLLHFVVSGNGEFKTARGEYSLGAGDVFIIRPEEITYYEADRDDPWEYYWISFDSGVRLPSVIMHRDHVFAPYLEELFVSAFEREDSTHGVGGYEEHLCSVIWEICARFKREEASVGRESAEDYVRRAIALMNSEMPDGVTVGQVADRLHLNRSYFTTLFTEVTGTSPGDHLKIMRMERAAGLLREGGYTVAVVAASVGYSDTFVFSRAFKAYFGVSPAEYSRRFGKA